MSTHSEGTLDVAGAALAFALDVPTSTPVHNLALIAHPWGRLGGTKEDHVVRTLARTLRDAGWAVCVYDARGAGASTGSASFTGAPEAADYKAVLERVLLPLLPATAPPAPATPPATILLAGYSFGSIAASACPPPPSHPSLRVRHLLISYPLSVLWALTLSHSSTFRQSLLDLVKSPSADVLALFGDSDQFSGVGPLRKWRDTLEGESDGRFKGVEVVGGDHFWRGDDLGTMMEFVRNWLDL